VHEAVRIVASSVIAGLWLALSVYVLKPNPGGFPRSVILITSMLVAFGTGGHETVGAFLAQLELRSKA